MGLRHPKLVAFEDRLRTVLHEVDQALESRHGTRFNLHPSRAIHGKTGNPTYDGLFQVSAAFSAGYGTHAGRGYVVEIRLVTLEHVPADIRHMIENDAVALLDGALENAFPERELEVTREGTAYKITGDISLGSA